MQSLQWAEYTRELQILSAQGFLGIAIQIPVCEAHIAADQYLKTVDDIKSKMSITNIYIAMLALWV